MIILDQLKAAVKAIGGDVVTGKEQEDKEDIDLKLGRAGRASFAPLIGQQSGTIEQSIEIDTSTGAVRQISNEEYRQTRDAHLAAGGVEFQTQMKVDSRGNVLSSTTGVNMDPQAVARATQLAEPMSDVGAAVMDVPMTSSGVPVPSGPANTPTVELQAKAPSGPALN